MISSKEWLLITFDWLTDRGIILVTEYSLEEEGGGKRGKWGTGQVGERGWGLGRQRKVGGGGEM